MKHTRIGEEVSSRILQLNPGPTFFYKKVEYLTLGPYVKVTIYGNSHKEAELLMTLPYPLTYDLDFGLGSNVVRNKLTSTTT